MREYPFGNVIQARLLHVGRWAWIASLILLVTALGACSSLPTLQEIAPEINATLHASPLFLVPDDQIEVSFPRKPEWNHTVTVRHDGRASFLFIDELVVARMTLAKLDETLTEEYGKKGVLDPVELTVNLANVAVRRVVVMGEVQTPGAVDIEGGHLSLIEAIGKAGGYRKDSAELGETLLVRWIPTEGRIRTWQFDASLDHWSSPIPVLLQSHDVVFIPNNTIDNVNIWVNKYIRQNLPLPLGYTVAPTSR